MNRALLLAALFPAAVASAFEIPTGGTPVRLDVTSTSIAAWHANNGNSSSCDDDFGAGIERLNLNGSWEGWVLGLRLDGSLYYPRPLVSGPEVTVNRCLPNELNSRYENALFPEKIFAGWKGRNLEVIAGDSYVSFGRGLSLSLRKSDELGLDTTQRGIRVRANSQLFSGTLVAGVTNINNVDEASGRFEYDPNDAVVGASGDVFLFDRVRLGGSASAFLFASPVSSVSPAGVDQSYQERWFVGGPKIEAPRLTDWLGVYLEGVAQRRETLTGEPTTGYGLYGSATAFAGPLTFLLEGKAYGDLRVVQPRFTSLEFAPVQYTSLPTLERVAQPLEHIQSETAGGRLRVDWNVTPTLSVFVNHGTFRDWQPYIDPTTGDALPGTIHDPYVGLDLLLGPQRVQFQSGSRFVLVRGNALRQDTHFDLNLVRDFGGGSSVELHAIHLERSEVLPFVSPRWREGTVQLGYRLRPVFAVGAVIDYSTEENQPRNADGELQTWYPGATGEWEITPSSNLRLFAGQSRGGLRCVSGVCRIFPPFSGVKGSLSIRY